MLFVPSGNGEWTFVDYQGALFCAAFLVTFVFLFFLSQHKQLMLNALDAHRLPHGYSWLESRDGGRGGGEGSRLFVGQKYDAVVFVPLVRVDTECLFFLSLL